VKRVGALLALLLIFTACGAGRSGAGACVGKTIDAISFGSPRMSLYQGELIRVCEDGSHLQRLSAEEVDFPAGIAVMGNGDRVVTSGAPESLSQQLSVIDRSGKLKATIRVPYCPAGVAINSDGLIIVGHKHGGALELDCDSTATMVSIYTKDLTEKYRFPAATATNFISLNDGGVLGFAYDNAPIFEITRDLHFNLLGVSKYAGPITDAAVNKAKLVVSTIRYTKASEHVGSVVVFSDFDSRFPPVNRVYDVPSLAGVAIGPDGRVFFAGSTEIFTIDLASGRPRVLSVGLRNPGKIAVMKSELLVENHHSLDQGADLEIYSLDTGKYERTLVRNIGHLSVLKISEVRG